MHLYLAELVAEVVAVGVGGLSAVEEAGRDVALEAVFQQAYPIAQPYAAAEAGSQVDTNPEEGYRMVVVVLAVRARSTLRVGRRLRRRFRGQRVRQDPLTGGLGRSRRRVVALDAGVRWLWRGRLKLGFSFVRGHREVVRGEAC